MPENVITDINKRWEEGIDHHPKSIELFKSIAEIDFEFCNDYFCWKSGGDGDNGETFMYELDIHFERIDAALAVEAARWEFVECNFCRGHGKVNEIVDHELNGDSVWHLCECSSCEGTGTLRKLKEGL